ncbi:hypothetical protein VPH35_126136 [Triticum aestivum]
MKNEKTHRTTQAQPSPARCLSSSTPDSLVSRRRRRPRTPATSLPGSALSPLQPPSTPTPSSSPRLLPQIEQQVRRRPDPPRCFRIRAVITRGRSAASPQSLARQEGARCGSAAPTLASTPWSSSTRRTYPWRRDSGA